MDWLTVFDPHPLGYQICLHTITVISTPIFFLGLYCVLWHSPKTTNKSFQRLLGSSLAFSFVSQFTISTGTAPVLVLPMTGGYPLGFFQYLGIPTTIQLVMVFHAVCAVILFTLLLFFNRHHILAPLPAVFNYLFIIVAVLMTVVIPFIINTLLLVNVDPPNDKQHFLKKYPELCNKIPNFWEDVVLMIDPSRNKMIIYVNSFYLIMVNFAIICIAFFVSRIKFHLNTNSMSATTKALHRAFVKTLIVQSSVHYILILIPSAGMMACFLFEIQLPGLSTFVFTFLALSDPCGIVALIASNKEYRKTTRHLICNSKNKLTQLAHIHTEVSSVLVIPAPQIQKKRSAPL